MEKEVVDFKGKVIDKIALRDEVFGSKVNTALLHQTVTSYLANQKSMKIASAKTRAEVKGSGAKPWRQKGTGRARVGEKRNPLWVKGGVVFGPKPRRVYKKIPVKMKARALESALSAKCKDGEMVILDSLQVSLNKTKDFANLLKKLKITKRSVFVDAGFSQELRKASSNLKAVNLMRASDLNAYWALNCRSLVITRKGIQVLEERLLKK